MTKSYSLATDKVGYFLFGIGLTILFFVMAYAAFHLLALEDPFQSFGRLDSCFTGLSMRLPWGTYS